MGNLQHIARIVASTVDMVATFDDRMTWESLHPGERYEIRFIGTGDGRPTYRAEITVSEDIEGRTTVRLISFDAVDNANGTSLTTIYCEGPETGTVRQKLTEALIQWYSTLIRSGVS